MRSKKQIVLGWVAALALGAASLQAETVYRGLDGWVTRADGKSFVDFAGQPIPSGFFCAGSKAFTGKVIWRGAPIATDDSRVTVDTMVQRLDDVTFDSQGRGVSRLQMKALSLESVAPIQTECGSYNVRANLADGRQPVTRMQIYLDGADGGRYLAPLAFNAKLTFTPAGRSGRTLELLRTIRAPSPVQLLPDLPRRHGGGERPGCCGGDPSPAGAVAEGVEAGEAVVALEFA